MQERIFRGRGFRDGRSYWPPFQDCENITSFLDQRLDETPYDVDASELRVLASATGLYTYPDVVVTCGEEQFLDNQFDTLLNPLLIIEVLSPSTEDYDRGKKFASYRTIPSSREYVMVAQDRVYAERFWFQEKGTWLYTEYAGPDAKTPLVSIGVELPMANVYRKLALMANATSVRATD